MPTMALVLILQLLTLWPLCHTDITWMGTQEAQGPRAPIDSVPPISYPEFWPPKLRRPIDSVPPTSYPKLRRPIDSVPPTSYPEFWPHMFWPPKLRQPIDSVPPTSSSKFWPPKLRQPIDSVPPTSYPEFWPHMFWPPKLRQPIDSVPPTSSSKFWPPKLRQPIDSVPPTSYSTFWPPKLRQPIDSVPPTSYPEFWPHMFWPPKLRRPIDSVPPTSYSKFWPPKLRQPIDSVPATSYPMPRTPTYSLPPTSYPKPSLGAQPAAVVTPGTNVTLTCWAPRPAWRFALFKSGEPTPVLSLSLHSGLAEFFLQEVKVAQAGSYHCCYSGRLWSQSDWSHPSDALELMVTDRLPGPTLVALPGPVVGASDTVSLRCAGRMQNMSFVLYRTGEAAPLQARESALPWADFPLPRERAPGTYVCYYHTPTAPYVLSPLSEPLVIRPDGSGSWDYTQGNLVRLGLASLVLISLATLVVLDWRSWRRAPANVSPEP